MNTWIVASAVLSIFIAWYIGRPLFDPIMASGAVRDGDRSYGALLDRKERALRALKDLELDFAMGKVSDEDFETAKRTLTIEATAILDELSKHATH